MNGNIYPWFVETWSQLVARREALPHALLLLGPQGIGKQELAVTFASALLCRSPDADGRSCGRCEACHWFAQDNHPDFRLVAPESDEPGEEGRTGGGRASRVIRIHQVRALNDWLAVGAHQSGWRVAVILPAEAMNPNAANALLKTLEEPPPLSLLVLVSHNPSRLLPTLRSRCQQVVCPLPGREAALGWLREQGVADPALQLALSSGAPLAARDSAGAGEELAKLFVETVTADPFNPFTAAARLAAVPLGVSIDLLQKWVYDAYCAQLMLPARYYGSEPQRAARNGFKARPERLLKFERRLAEARRLVDHPLNARLVLEDLFAAYGEAVSAQP